MAARAEAADLRVVTTHDQGAGSRRQRGAEIKRRRIRMGFSSVRGFAEAVGRDRQAVTRAEAGEASARTYDFLEAWLDERELEMSSEADDAKQAAGDDTPQAAAAMTPAEEHTVTIKMSGVYGIDDVTVSGPVENLAELRQLAIELMRGVREQEQD